MIYLWCRFPYETSYRLMPAHAKPWERLNTIAVVYVRNIYGRERVQPRTIRRSHAWYVSGGPSVHDTTLRDALRDATAAARQLYPQHQIKDYERAPSKPRLAGSRTWTPGGNPGDRGPQPVAPLAK